MIGQGRLTGRGTAGLGIALAAATVALVLPASGSAATWTPASSNTTEDITAIEYQGPDRFWFTTANGKIFRRVGGVFQQEFSLDGLVFNDIEFQGGSGQVGFAVGANGALYRSANAGDTWAAVTGIVGGRTSDGNCNAADEPLGEVRSINFAGDARAWITAGVTQVFRTVNGATAANVGSNAAGWLYTNDNGASCRVPGQIDDVVPIGASGSLYLFGRLLGDVFFSGTDLATPGTLLPAPAGDTGLRRAVRDPSNPNSQWAVAPNAAGGEAYLRRTDNGWITSQALVLGGPVTAFPTMYDIDVAGGTVVTVGSAGVLANSTDGTTFYTDTGPGALATEEWISVGAASATAAAAGGRNGSLVLTDNANVLNTPVAPDTTAPETTITKAPKRKVKTKKKKKVKAKFEFISTEPGSTFTCSLDGKPFAPCSSPHTVKVKKGKHGLEVVATDAAGNADATPAAYSWKVKKKKKRRR